MQTAYSLIVTIVVLAVTGLFIYLLLFSGTNDDLESLQDRQQQEEPVLQEAEQEQNLPPITWETYTNEDFNFTFVYPSAASTTVENGRVKVTYLGPENTPNTEITDGFTFYVESVELEEGQTLETFANAQFEQEEDQLEVFVPLRNISIDDKQAYEYQIESMLGLSVTHIMLETEEGIVFVVSYMLAGPAERGYTGVIAQMIQSLTLTGLD